MKSRKMLFAIVAIFIMITVLFAACKKKNVEGAAYVTDENGVQLTDVNGEPITIIPETSVVTITDGNGNVVTNANGEPETSIYYKPQQVVVPVTNENHEAVTGPNGEILTTVIWFPADPTTTAIETVTVTDSNGNPVTTPEGNPVTETTIVSAANKSFLKTIGGTTGFDEAIAIEPALDGGTFAIVSGTSKDGLFASISNTKDNAFSICKHDAEGTLVWSKAFGGASSVSAQDICTTSDGGIVIVGQTRANDFMSVHGSEYDAFIMKLDKDGNEVFRKPWGGTSNENFFGVEVAPDGSIYAAGFAYSQDGDTASLAISAGDARAVIVKYDSNGNVLKTVGVCGFGDYFTDIVIAKNGDVFAVASISASSTQTLFEKRGRSDAAVFKFDKDLNVKFSKLFGGSGIDRFEAIATTDDGGCVIAGASTSSNGDLGSEYVKNKGGEDAVIAKFSGSGSLLFVKSFYGDKNESFKDVTITPQGYIIAVGESQSATRDFIAVGKNKGGKDAFAVKYDANGNLQAAEKGFCGSADDSALAVCVMTNGQVVMAGKSTSTDEDFSGKKPASDGTNSIAVIKTLSF